MAEALEVTNSTYHNWRRKTTVPHANQQETIVTRLRALSGNAGITVTKTPGSKRAATAKNGSVPKVSRQAAHVGSVSDGGSLNGSGSRVASHLRELDQAESEPSSQMARVTPVSLVASHDVPRAVAQITVAFIHSQKKAPTAGSILKFVEGLKEMFKRGT
jgi:hypothetical protein